MKIRLSLIAMLFAVMLLAVANAQEKKEQPKLPEGVQGCSGTVQGKVVLIRKGRFVFDVEKVLKVWKNSKAEKPENLTGVKIIVGASCKMIKNNFFRYSASYTKVLSCF